MIDAVSSIVMTGRWMKGRDKPEENCVSFCGVCCFPSLSGAGEAGIPWPGLRARRRSVFRSHSLGHRVGLVKLAF